MESPVSTGRLSQDLPQVEVYPTSLLHHISGADNMARDNRTDHDILVCVEQKVDDLRTGMRRVCTIVGVHDRKIVAVEQQSKTLFNRQNRHEKNHLWWGGAIISIVGIIVTVGYWIVSNT